MKKSRHHFFLTILVGAALIWVALFFFWGPSNSPVNSLTTPSEANTAADSPPNFHVTGPLPQPTPSPESPLPLLGPHLREIGDCLKINNSLNSDAELKFSALDDSLRHDLGQLIANESDWKNVHITLPNGEKRRLRLEVEATSEEGSALTLKYFGVDKEDLPIPIPLTKEQSRSPSPEYITSIENQGKVTLREEARRGVYSHGAELYYTERNGSLSDLELSYDGKIIKCQDLQSRYGICSCI